MTKTQFITLKKWIDKGLDEVQDQALTEGSSIAEINEALPILKQKLLESKDINPQVYSDWENKEFPDDTNVPVEANPYEKQQEKQERKGIKEAIKKIWNRQETEITDKSKGVEETKKEIESKIAEIERQRDFEKEKMRGEIILLKSNAEIEKAEAKLNQWKKAIKEGKKNQRDYESGLYVQTEEAREAYARNFEQLPELEKDVEAFALHVQEVRDKYNRIK